MLRFPLTISRTATPKINQWWKNKEEIKMYLFRRWKSVKREKLQHRGDEFFSTCSRCGGVEGKRDSTKQLESVMRSCGLVHINQQHGCVPGKFCTKCAKKTPFQCPKEGSNHYILFGGSCKWLDKSSVSQKATRKQKMWRLELLKLFWNTILQVIVSYCI